MEKDNSTNMFLPKNISNVNAAILSKLVGSNGASSQEKIDVSVLESISKKARGKTGISKDIMELFPDVEFCADTVAHSILSPGDMYTRGLRLTLPNIKIGGELKGLIINEIKSQLKHYNFEAKQADIIKNALFINGSHAEIYIPEAALDEMISKGSSGEITLESYGARASVLESKMFKKKPMKIKDLPYLTTESAKGNDKQLELNIEDSLLIKITDDVSVLNDKVYESHLINKSTNNRYSLTTESSTDNNRRLSLKEIFRDPDKYEKMEDIKVSDYKSSRRESVGRPLVLHVEHYAIKPIWSGTPDNHIGYFLLLDDKGNPVRDESNLESDDEMPGMTNVTASTVNNLINKAKVGLQSMSENDGGEIPNSEEVYGRILEDVIIKRMSDTPLADIGNFNENQNFTKIMFNRAMRGKQTRILFLPYDLVAYYAYDFKNNGVGRSKLEKVSILYSMRAIMLFGTLMANIKNSIPITEVEAVIDEQEPDVESAMKMIINHTLRNRQLELPLGIPRTQDLVTWVRHLGLVFNFKHSKLPDTEIKATDTSRNIKVPEDTVTEKLEELIYMQFGLNADQVRNGMNQANFASTLINQNKLFTNRIMIHQDKTEPMQSRHVSTIIRNDAVIRNNILDIIENNQTQIKSVKDKFKLKEKEMFDVILELVIEDITVKLPKPESNEGDNLGTKLEEHTRGIDAFLEIMFNRDVMESYSVGEEISANVDHLKGIMKAMMTKEWAVENNYMKGFVDFTTLDDEDNSINDYMKQFEDMMSNFGTILVPFIKSMKKKSKKVDEKIDKAVNGADEPDVVEEEVTDDTTGDESTEEPSVDTVEESPIVGDEPLGETEGDDLPELGTDDTF